MAKNSKAAGAGRSRRSEDELIAALEAKIAQIKRKAEQKKVKKDPALRHITGAVRSIEKALGATGDHALKQALDEARATLSACLSLSGVSSKSDRGTLTPRPRSSGQRIQADTLLEHVRKNPGQRGEQIAAALGTDTAAMRPVMRELIDAGKVRTQGQRRGMAYSAA